MKKRIRLMMILGLMVVFSVVILEINTDCSLFCGDEPSKSAPVHDRFSEGQAVHQPLESSPEDDKVTIVIDPGHGGDDPGATGASGAYEKVFNLDVALKVFQLFKEEPEINAFLTREDDRFLSSETNERPEFANALNADLFISLHANTYTDPTVSGTETFYYYDHSKALADTVHAHVVNATGFSDRGVKHESYFVLRETTMPSILIEIGYISNPHDEQRMLTDHFQQSVAQSIVEGVKEYVENYM